MYDSSQPIKAFAVDSDPYASAPMAPAMSQPLMAFDEGGAREVLSEFKWPEGLQNTFVKTLSKIPIRFFICDDSGSMASTDGHRTVDVNGNKKLISCSRWSELTDALRFHSKLALGSHAPSEFRLLNGAPPLMIGSNDPDEHRRYQQLISTFDSSPTGGTPLCLHIGQIINTIRGMEQQLRSNGQKACVVIFTDGESSDGDVAQAMRPLKDLPVFVVLRLCTDDDRVVKYWNSVDQELELDMDVLDDFCGEGHEVHEHNPWLTYGEPLHRLREFGLHVKEVDLLDEKKLSLEQVRLFCSLIFGGELSKYPHPEADFTAFVNFVASENKRVPQVWSPTDKVIRDWVNIKQLQRLNPHGGGCVVC